MALSRYGITATRHAGTGSSGTREGAAEDRAPHPEKGVGRESGSCYGLPHDARSSMDEDTGDRPGALNDVHRSPGGECPGASSWARGPARGAAIAVPKRSPALPSARRPPRTTTAGSAASWSCSAEEVLARISALVAAHSPELRRGQPALARYLTAL
ncbi:hypothetical protein [Streptomyces axinellae]|uniref:hypothetical protein n=1 Tax=Streptomyces axinellae TaxID=552788 RepID=UPI0031E2E44E